MQELEKILEEIEQKKEKCLNVLKMEIDPMEITIHREQYKGLCMPEKSIRKHMNDGWIPVDKNNVPDHEILACDRYKNELIGYLSYNADSEEFVCESDECIMYQVIAWMEKPEPYRPERRI